MFQSPQPLSTTSTPQPSHLVLGVDFASQPFLHYHHLRERATSMARILGMKLNPSLGLNEFFIVHSDAEYALAHQKDLDSLSTSVTAVLTTPGTKTRAKTAALKSAFGFTVDYALRPTPQDPGRINDSMDSQIKILIHKERREDYMYFIEASTTLRSTLLQWIGPALAQQLTSEVPLITLDDVLPHHIINLLEDRFSKADFNMFDTLNRQLAQPCPHHRDVISHLTKMCHINATLRHHGAPLPDLLLLNHMYKALATLPSVSPIVTLYNQSNPDIRDRSTSEFQKFLILQLPTMYEPQPVLPTYVAAVTSPIPPRDVDSIKREIAALNRQLRSMSGTGTPTPKPSQTTDRPKSFYCFHHDWNPTHWTDTCKTLQTHHPDKYALCKSARQPCKCGTFVGAGFTGA